MPAKRDTIERLDLTFRAEAAPVARTNFPSGLLLCCLVGIGAGIACWLIGRQQLATSLSNQLVKSTSTAEALLAVEGLLMLDADSSLEIVRGLENSKLEVARTAYRTLDAQITRWQTLESAVEVARLEALAKRLEQLSDATPVDNLVLASSLASRIFSICLERDDPQLRPLMRMCETVFQRVGTARSRFDADTERLESNLATALPPPPMETQYTFSETTYTKPIERDPQQQRANSIQDIPQTPALPISVDANLASSSSLPTATMRMTVGQTRQRAHVRLSDEAMGDESPSYPQELDATGSIEASPGGSAASAMAVNELPVVVGTPASLSSTPIVQMKLVSRQVDLDGIQQLEIEELVRLLASVQPRVAQAAALALRAKGMDDTKLSLASELARGSAARRLELVQQIATNGAMEPRPWLLWMAEDGEPEVRKLAVSLLSSMLDADVERCLRNLLGRERDVQVERTIREVLLVHGGR